MQYRIHFTRTERFWVDVEADSKNAAIERAEELWDEESERFTDGGSGVERDWLPDPDKIEHCDAFDNVCDGEGDE